MERMDMDKIDSVFGGSFANEFRRVEKERASLMKAVANSQSLAEQIMKLEEETSLSAQIAKQARDLQAFSSTEQKRWFIPEDSVAVQMAKFLQVSQMAEKESIRRMLDPLQDIRRDFLANSGTNRLLEDLTKPFAASKHTTSILEQASASNAFIQAMHSSIDSSMESARKLLDDASVSSGIGQLMKSFGEVDKRWVVPQTLLNSLGPLQALQEQMGRLSLPVMDVASASTLASVLGPGGIQAQLAALGINPDGSINLEFIQQEEGIGLSRKSLELMTLLSFIFAVLIPLYQEISSSQWQAATEKTLAAQTQAITAQGDALEGQRKMIEALTKLVEKALVQEAKRREERFVVLERVAVVRSKPEHGSAVEGKLLPREVVRPISESGKWIEFEYYHWLHKEHRIGWALKKFFQRVSASFQECE